MSSNKEFDGDAGAPLPDFTTNIQLQTVAPALGVRGNAPDYLDYDQKGRGVVTTMFANTGAAYMMGIAGGGIYGLRTGLSSTPSSRFKVKLNSVLNHCGRYGSRTGNTLGVFAVLYSLYEGLADHVSLLLGRWGGSSKKLPFRGFLTFYLPNRLLFFSMTLTRN
jgi:Tim17/Tim22/Tim23/Pmp24 family